MQYPPFGKTINIILSSEDEKLLEKDVNEFFNRIKTDLVDIFGPFQAPIYRIKNRYRYQIFIKGKRENINKFKSNLLEVIKSHKEKKVRLSIDVDPINLM